jgi:hypothetical protein
MNMLLISSYSFGNRSAEVYQLREGQFLVEFYEDKKLQNKVTLANLLDAKKIADNYTDTPHGINKTLLNE